MPGNISKMTMVEKIEIYKILPDFRPKISPKLN